MKKKPVKLNIKYKKILFFFIILQLAICINIIIKISVIILDYIIISEKKINGNKLKTKNIKLH